MIDPGVELKQTDFTANALNYTIQDVAGQMLS